LQRYEEKLMTKKGFKYLQIMIKIEIDHKTCVSKGFFGNYRKKSERRLL